MVAQRTFTALADPTRRRILELLRSGELSAGDVAAHFPAVSRPAVSRHLRVLRDAGLARCRGDAQRRLYRLDATPLAHVERWLAHYRSFWEGRLDALERHLGSDRHDDA